MTSEELPQAGSHHLGGAVGAVELLDAAAGELGETGGWSPDPGAAARHGAGARGMDPSPAAHSEGEWSEMRTSRSYRNGNG